MKYGPGEIYDTHTDPCYHIHYCPWWFMRSEQYYEVISSYNHYQSHNMAAYWSGGNIPHALDRAIQAFSHGYKIGKDSRPKSD